jgi:transcriptional regulator with XRE-family HTH domain
MGKRERKQTVLDVRFREKLSRLIEERGTKNQELAAHLSRAEGKTLTDGYISQIKSGERGVSFDRAVEIANFFGVDAGTFFQRPERRRLFRSLFPVPNKRQERILREGHADVLFDKFKEIAAESMEPERNDREQEG